MPPHRLEIDGHSLAISASYFPARKRKQPYVYILAIGVGNNFPLIGKYLHIYEICVPRFHTAPLWGFIPIHLPQFVCFALCTMSVVLCPLSNISRFSIAYELMNCPRCPPSSVFSYETSPHAQRHPGLRPRGAWSLLSPQPEMVLSVETAPRALESSAR